MMMASRGRAGRAARTINGLLMGFSNTMPAKVRIGTRGSDLALWQARYVAGRIEALGVGARIVVIRTGGDIDQRTPISQLGSKAIFIKELEDALLDRRIDLAVHSLKDLPAQLPDGLELAAVPARETPLDAWICPEGFTVEQAPQGIVVASGSLRRSAQLLALRPDLRIVPIRGNVPSRLKKLRRGEASATILAMAGLCRLGLEENATAALDTGLMTPAMGQGALGVETRRGELADLASAIDDPAEHQAARTERGFMRVLGGGCRTPAGILVRPDGESWSILAMLASADGRQLMRRAERVAPGGDPEAEARKLAVAMLAEAPPQILETLERTA